VRKRGGATRGLALMEGVAGLNQHLKRWITSMTPKWGEGSVSST